MYYKFSNKYHSAYNGNFIKSPSTFGLNYVGSNKRRHLNLKKKIRNKHK